MNAQVSLREADRQLDDLGLTNDRWRDPSQRQVRATGRDELGEVSVVHTAMARSADAAIVAVRLLVALAAPYHVRGEDRTVGRGIGVAS